MLLKTKLSFNLWSEAILTAYNILNRIPLKKNNISTYKIWKGRKPNIEYFKVWECLTYCQSMDP